MDVEKIDIKTFFRWAICASLKIDHYKKYLTNRKCLKYTLDKQAKVICELVEFKFLEYEITHGIINIDLINDECLKDYVQYIISMDDFRNKNDIIVYLEHIVILEILSCKHIFLKRVEEELGLNSNTLAKKTV
ncbi:hypothetical protein NIES21_08100 [Anabaenopsis circularis NIES-21]|uniref:Uncharacterized protein n=1 Tax=Anabaenopsis circularis NIES-21 TaxID=1085406 RepID=A0A1Z4GBY5_9CYAN|nr:hypothetical protein NIES21_08100 [Anabaenopsis circularis NIES-21]